MFLDYGTNLLINKVDIMIFKSFLTNQTSKTIIRIIGVLLFVYIALITAWVSDDAMISFRQILNFISGDGIVFNFGERVQAFTHPLWFFLLSGFILVSGEMFITTSILSVVISVLAIIVFVKLELTIAKSSLTYISPVFFLAFSFAFCDYMTSGLENPMSYLLVSLLLYYLFQENMHKHLQLIFLILALLVLNRFEYLILFAPLAILLMFSSKIKSELFRVLLPGSALIFAWIIFATFYFGSPLPNTFYAKLNAGYPKSEVFARGIEYLLSLKHDPASILILLLGFFSITLHLNRYLIALFLGKVFYLGYIVYIGGDFMLGRFYSVLVVLSVGEFLVVIYKSHFSEIVKNYVLFVFLTIFIFIGLISSSPINSRIDYLARKTGEIIDERAVNYHLTGIFAKYRERWPVVAKFNETAPDNYRIICGTIGAVALMDTSKFHIDPCALTDPFLSRIPAIRYPNWRIGHHFRKVPLEFGQHKLGKINNLPDSDLKELIDDVTLVTRGELFSIARFEAIWRLLTNSHSISNLDKYTDPKIWIPLTESFDLIELENWEEEIQVDNRPYWLVRHPQRNFNNNLKVFSRVPKKSSIIWILLNWGYTYNLSVNSGKIYTIDTHNHNQCPYGMKIYLERETLVESIEIQAIDDLDISHFGFNYITSIRLQDRTEHDPNFLPNCIKR